METREVEVSLGEVQVGEEFRLTDAQMLPIEMLGNRRCRRVAGNTAVFCPADARVLVRRPAEIVEDRTSGGCLGDLSPGTWFQWADRPKYDDYWWEVASPLRRDEGRVRVRRLLDGNYTYECFRADREVEVIRRRPAERTIKRSELRRGMFIQDGKATGLLLNPEGPGCWWVSIEQHGIVGKIAVHDIHAVRWPNETEWRKVVDDEQTRCPTCGKEK